MKNALRILSLFAAYLVAGIGPSIGAQNNLWSPTTGTVSGLTLTQNYNNAFTSLASCSSGATAPANDQSAAALAYQCWIDTSVTPARYRLYDGSSTWVIVGYIDATNHIWVPITGGGIGTVASGSTTDLCSVPNTYVSITGAVTITSFSNTCATGTVKVLNFVSTPLVTYNATSLILPSAANITAQAGDSAILVYLGSGNWRATGWTRADGTSVATSAVFTGAVFFDGVISPAALGSSTNNWNPTGLATANVIRFSCSTPINITGITAPATDGQVILLDNIGATNTCTITSQDTNSTAANRFSIPFAIPVRPLGQVAIRYDLTTARWKLWQEITTQPIAGGFKNLRVFNVATAFSGDTAPSTPNSQMKIAADELTVEDGNGTGKRLTSVACTIVASGNAFSSGSGGLDTGSLSAGNWYSQWVIYNPATNTTSCLASLASTIGTITLPSGYTFAARVGWNYYWTNNSVTGFNRLIQYGRWAHLVAVASTPTPAPLIVASGSAGSISVPTWIAISLTNYVPSTALRASFIVSVQTGNYAIFAPNNAYGPYTSTTILPPCVVYPGAGTINTQCALTLESGNVYWANSTSASYIAITEWEDNL